LSFISIVLFFLAAINSLKQKSVLPPTGENPHTNY